jgi:hypothetical protein
MLILFFLYIVLPKGDTYPVFIGIIARLALFGPLCICTLFMLQVSVLEVTKEAGTNVKNINVYRMNSVSRHIIKSVYVFEALQYFHLFLVRFVTHSVA